MQGDRTVGIPEVPTQAMLARLDAHFGITSPRAHGHGAVDALQAMRDGRSKACISLGGNLAVAMPDPKACFAAFKIPDLSVNILTKFNRTCLLLAKRRSFCRVSDEQSLMSRKKGRSGSRLRIRCRWSTHRAGF